MGFHLGVENVVQLLEDALRMCGLVGGFVGFILGDYACKIF